MQGGWTQKQADTNLLGVAVAAIIKRTMFTDVKTNHLNLTAGEYVLTFHLPKLNTLEADYEKGFAGAGDDGVFGAYGVRLPRTANVPAARQ